jgi:hypothetical protein
MVPRTGVLFIEPSQAEFGHQVHRVSIVPADQVPVQLAFTSPDPGR